MSSSCCSFRWLGYVVWLRVSASLIGITILLCSWTSDPKMNHSSAKNIKMENLFNGWWSIVCSSRRFLVLVPENDFVVFSRLMDPSSKTMVCLSTTQCRYIELLLQSPVHQPVIHQSIGPLAKQNLIIILHLHLECHCFQKCISIAVVVPHRTIRFVVLSYNHRIPQTHLMPILGILIHTKENTLLIPRNWPIISKGNEYCQLCSGY